LVVSAFPFALLVKRYRHNDVRNQQPDFLRHPLNLKRLPANLTLFTEGALKEPRHSSQEGTRAGRIKQFVTNPATRREKHASLASASQSRTPLAMLELTARKSFLS
jgi:hypothetical protein